MRTRPDVLDRARQSDDPEVRAAMAFVDDLRLRDLLEPFTMIASRHSALVTEMFGRSRIKHVTAARHEAWGHLRELGWSYPAIARLFGRDHTTVMSAVRAVRGPGVVPCIPDLVVGEAALTETKAG